MEKDELKMIETLSIELLQSNIASSRKEAEDMAKKMIVEVIDEMAM